MAVTKKANVANAIPDKIQQMVEDTFADMLFMTKLVTRDYTSELATNGDRVTVNSYATATANNAEGGFTPEALSESAVEVIMDQWKVASFAIDGRAQKMGVHDWERVITQRIVEPMANVLEDALFGLYTDATTNNYTATGTNGGLKHSDLVKIERKLGAVNAHTNQNGRYDFVISRFDNQELLQDSNIIRADYSGDGGRAMREAYIGYSGGLDLYVSNRIPSSGTSTITYHSLCFGKSAMGMVTGIPSQIVTNGIEIRRFTDERSGITFRIVGSFNHTGGFYDTISCDLMYGVKTMNESHMVDVTSQETP